MEQKGFISAILVIIVFALLGAGAYVTLKYNASRIVLPHSPVPQPEPVPEPSPAPIPPPPVPSAHAEPIITSISPASGTVGTKIEINGKNFAGFEGDLYAWIENAKGVRGLLRGERGSTASKLIVILDPSLCQNDTSYSGKECTAWLTLVPGEYTIYIQPWGKKSNAASFIIKAFPKGVASLTELKYKLESIFGRAVFCGPPVEYPGYTEELIAKFPEVQKNTEEFSAILKHLNWSAKTEWSDNQKLIIMGEHNQLSVINFEDIGNSRHTFSLHARNSVGEFIYEGTISAAGEIELTKKTAYNYGCPICLAGTTMIDTPLGPRRITELKKGMPVWTQNKAGERVSGIILETANVYVGAYRQFRKLVWADGRELLVSAGHPTSDGKTIGDLKAGELYDGSLIVSITQVPNSEGMTYDILPSGDTGFYWANGALLGSTLANPVPAH